MYCEHMQQSWHRVPANPTVNLGSVAHVLLRSKGKSDEFEREGLLATSQVEYGTNRKPSDTTTSAPPKRGGWLDYFIGFRILFPYLW
jgi:hypothetical protein